MAPDLLLSTTLSAVSEATALTHSLTQMLLFFWLDTSDPALVWFDTSISFSVDLFQFSSVSYFCFVASEGNVCPLIGRCEGLFWGNSSKFVINILKRFLLFVNLYDVEPSISKRR